MRISGRERMLLIVTGTVICAAIVYRFGIGSIYESLRSSSEQLGTVEKTYQRYVKQLDQRDRIERAYGEIEDQFPKRDPGHDPAHQFSEEVDALCSQLGFANPNIEPAKERPIEDVEDYRFILLTIKTEGDFASVVRLLKGFDSKSLLIRELTLNSYLDQDRLRIAVTVARIVKAEKVAEPPTSRPRARRLTSTAAEEGTL
jgi:hypothetical protein